MSIVNTLALLWIALHHLRLRSTSTSGVFFMIIFLENNYITDGNHGFQASLNIQVIFLQLSTFSHFHFPPIFSAILRRYQCSAAFPGLDYD